MEIVSAIRECLIDAVWFVAIVATPIAGVVLFIWAGSDSPQDQSPIYVKTGRK